MAAAKELFFVVPHPYQEGYKIAARMRLFNGALLKVGEDLKKVFASRSEAMDAAEKLNKKAAKV
jgi:hypothetical protein